MDSHERVIRERLGIPASAERALVLAEASHWDPSWLFTSEEYFARMVRPALDAPIATQRRRGTATPCPSRGGDACGGG